MSAIAIIIVIGLGIGWLITGSDGKIGDVRVTSGNGKGSFFGKIILVVGGIFLFLLLIVLANAP